MAEFCIELLADFTSQLQALQNAVLDGGGSEDLAYDVRLIASELAGNVFRYSQKKKVKICYEQVDGIATISVYGDVAFDDCCTCPAITKDRGRGMWIIRTLDRYLGFEKKNGVVRIKLNAN